MTTMPSFGLFTDLRNPEPWKQPWPAFLRGSVELIERAERLGAGAVWVTEHHLFPDGHLSQPLAWLSALAARTSTIRLGTGILIAPLRHPRHVAEQAALVDALSGGRLELGLGPGYAAPEFAEFGRTVETRFGETEASLTAIRRLWQSGRLGPEPVQPDAPLWLGYQGPRNARRAGRLGAGLLTLNRSSVEPYLAGLAEGGFAVSDARMGGTVDLVVARDPERAWDRIKPHYQHQLDTYANAHGGTAGVTVALDSRLASERSATVSVRLSVVDVDEAVAIIARRIAGMPVRHVYTWARIAGMPLDLVDEHVELFLTEVAPRVRKHLGDAR